MHKVTSRTPCFALQLLSTIALVEHLRLKFVNEDVVVLSYRPQEIQLAGREVVGRCGRAALTGSICMFCHYPKIETGTLHYGATTD
jgi:hypothetical protein